LKSQALNHKIYSAGLKSSASLKPAGAQQPDPTDRDAMILKYTPLIKYIAHRLALRLPPHVSVEDLMSAGVIGLIDALTKFDPQKKVQFKTYAEFRIKGAMLDELRSLDWVSRSVRQKAAQLEKAYQSLEKKKGRAVDDEEVAKEMGISLDNYYGLVNEVNGVFLLDFENLRHKIPKLPEEELINLLMDDLEKLPLHLLGVEELKRVLAQSIEELTPKEKTVISLYYYEELTLKEIGEVLGFTESRICQIHAKAILKLKSKIRPYLRESG